FLTGSLAQLRQTWRAYHIAVQIESGEIDHTPGLVVISQRGRLQKVDLPHRAASGVTQSVQVLTGDVAGPLPGPPTVARRARAGARGPRDPPPPRPAGPPGRPPP